MKIQYKVLSIVFLLFSTSCGNGAKVDTSYIPSKPGTPDTHSKTDTSSTPFLDQLVGVYEGVHDGRTFEVRIEVLEQYPAKGEQLLLFVFEKKKLSDIQEFLTKYTSVPAYSEAICKYVKENPDKFSAHDLQTSPSMFYDISADEVWKWEISLGSLSDFFVPNNATVSSFDVSPRHYIDLYKDDEYGVKKLHINSSGKAVKIQFFETGFIKKPWSYFISGPSMEIQKISSEAEKLFAPYYNIINETRELFIKAGEKNRSYCEEK